ncbi:unconventional myosin heavy chain 6-like isoform X2 [Watersipora subatra]|uniref:unconventional myosin heavy chain 6-like isoform X2 n=1 Tax=Watersipora subatra TaxID=2589382 RepID=UPI00355C1D0C
MAYDRHRHGKDYIISMFMESIYLSRKYWQNLQPVNLNKEKTFPHLHCMEASLMAADKSSREYGRAQMADDLCQVIGPISDESVCKILEERFHLHSYHTFIGPTLIALNPQTHRLPDKALNCRDLSENLQLLANNVIEDVMEKKQSQSIIVSGESGSGKTKISMEILRHLYNVVGGGSSTDAFKLISAAVTAIRPFDMTATPTNQEASRSCWCVECSISSHAVTSTRITLHCLPRNRLTDRPTFERGYDIFYMVLIGMSSSEREHCHLVGQDEDSLVYLQNTHRKPLHARKYQEKYSYWKSSLLTLGINHLDVLKVLAAVLLIGNFSFTEGDDGKVDLVGNTELQATATLLGVPVACLYQALTGRTVYTQRRYHRAAKSIDAANKSRHLLAESLFSRLFQHLLRKINQTTESHTPSLNVTKKDSKLSTGSLDAHSIYIIDCLAFQNTQGTQLERLCSNIGAEAIQHFYNMHMFHQLLDSYDDDNISIQSDIRWYDNSSTIQLLSQQNVGLVSLISSESKDPQPRPRSLIRKLEKLHSNSVSLELNRSRNLFTIQHFGGRVMYDSESLLLEDRNCLDDDVVALFSKQSTHFSLLSKLYGKELKDMEANGGKARGANYRVLSCQSRPYDTKQSSHSQDFLFSIDRLMQTLACSNSTFIRCIKASLSNCARHWDADFVKRQMMVLEVTETVKLLAGGLPHRLSYKQFISKYKCLICCRKSRPSAASTDYYQDCCQEILHQYLRIMESKSVSYSSANWVFGQKHIFLR